MVQPRTSDLVALAKILPPAAIVLSFDLETCAAPNGGDARVPGRARIVQFGLAAFSGQPLDADAKMVVDDSSPPSEDGEVVCAGYLYTDMTYVDPKVRIDAGSQTKHHITDADVRGAPVIADLADTLHAWLVQGAADDTDATATTTRPVYLCGYNAAKYDVPALAAELRRVGRGDVADVLVATPVLDCMLIRRAADPAYTLEGTLARYGLQALGDAAHAADADSLACLAVLAAQAAAGHLPADLTAACELAAPKAPPADAVDLQGKLRWVGGAPPTPPKPTQDNVCVDFGAHKGKTLRQAGAAYCKWICGKDFPDDTKAAIRTAFGPTAARW